MNNYKNKVFNSRKIFRRDMNFLGLDSPLSDYDRARVVVLPVPYDSTTSIKTGTRNGPSAIINASYNLESYDEEMNINIAERGIHTFNELEPEMTGPKFMVERIYKVWRELLKDNKFVMMLGGEHSIAPGAVKALKEKYRHLSVLYIDAHTDLRDEYEGSEFNHASAARRVLEFAPVTQVGIRCVAAEELANIKKFKSKLHIFYAQDINYEFEKIKNWVGRALATLSPHVYISIDLDGLDPSIMPAVGTPLPGGLGFYQALNLFKEAFKSKTVVGVDINELSPLVDNIAPNYLAARLAFKLLVYKFYYDQNK